MDAKGTISLVLIGLGAVAAGGLGLRLPAGDRIAAGLALVVGAGVGVIAVAIGSQLVADTPESYETVLVAASALGFVATVMSLAVLWHGTERERPRSRGAVRSDPGGAT